MKHEDKPIIHIRIDDYKDTKGLWVATKSVTTSTNRLFYTTHSGDLYHGVLSRCKVGGEHQSRFPTYVGCECKFQDFQEFAEWCSHSEGYRYFDPNGKCWTLDKDILVKGNKEYSPDKCCFVPEYVNNLFVNKQRKDRGEFPIGVTKAGGRSKRFKARCIVGSERLNLGNYLTPELAHHAWQEAKITQFMLVIDAYANEPTHRQDVIDALLFRKDLILRDLSEGLITDVV